MINLYQQETIVAIATPPGKSGVGIVRISGNNALEIAIKLAKSNLILEPNKMILHDIFAGDIVDRGYFVYFKNPKSFTGEDVVEIQAHGSYYLLQQIVEQIIAFGARLAMPGEFSKRAFLNGKMSFDQAEGIADLINSESFAEAKMASELMRGELGNSITSMQNDLLYVLASVETKLDYPEYEFDQNEKIDILNKIKLVYDNLKVLYDTHPKGKLIKNGVRVAVVGKPNVGKSSLLNRLCGEDKAIVTDIAGTTRDIIEADFEFKGIIFHLYDTAGLRDSNDLIEQIGIDKAKKLLSTSDLVLSLKEVGDEYANVNNENQTPIIYVVNKIDLNDNIKEDKNAIYISALKNDNIDKLKEKMFDVVMKNGYDLDKLYLTNERHIQCVKNALNDLENAINNFEIITLDFIVSDIRSAWQNLGELTGKTANEEIIDEIFSKFCLGK